jgi:glyoxylase-like metal-dependent hydrolase (beta-lactamase superfamily II)
MALSFRREAAVDYGRLETVAPGLRRIVARNPSPYTLHGTGTYVIGAGSVAVIDPGPADDAHVEALLSGLAGERISHILVTHTHLDHSPAARLLSRQCEAPIWGCAPHPALDDGFTGEAGGDIGYRPDRELLDGDVIVGADWSIDVIHTPGHTSNHLCFGLAPLGYLFTGDHAMGWSTSVVSPPDGDMRAYMASLLRLAERQDRIAFPTHGPAIESPQAWMRELHAHRVEREAMVVGALQSGLDRIGAIVERIYPGLDPRLVRPAGRTTWAHLRKLVDEGRAISTDADLRPASASPEARYRLA